MMKKIFLGLVLCALAVVSANDSRAESSFCSNVEVIYIGPTDTATVLKVRSNRNDCTPDFAVGTERVFILDSVKAKELLATALSAQASGFKITLIPKVKNRYVEFATMRGIYTQSTDNP